MNMDRDESGSPWGCILGGCLGAFVLMILAAVGVGVMGYRMVSSQIDKYTSPDPVVLPKVVYNEAQLQSLKDRVQTITEGAMNENEPAPTIELTDDDINALISQEKELQGRVYVTISDGKVTGEVSMPLDQIPGGKRYFNGSATLSVEAVDGKPVVKIAEASVNGETVPASALAPIQEVNFAEDIDFTHNDRKIEIESIEVIENRLIITPRITPTTTEDPAPDGATEPELEPVGTN